MFSFLCFVFRVVFGTHPNYRLFMQLLSQQNRIPIRIIHFWFQSLLLLLLLFKNGRVHWWSHFYNHLLCADTRCGHLGGQKAEVHREGSRHRGDHARWAQYRPHRRYFYNDR